MSEVLISPKTKIIKESLFRFPPDLTFGYVPNKSHKFRIVLSIIHVIKNVLPLIVLEQVQSDLWSSDKTYEDPQELIAPILRLIPFLLSLIIIFPLSAAGNKLDRNWEKYLADDYKSFKFNFRRRLPLDDQSFDLFNNKMDIINKIFFYISFGMFSTGIIIQATFKIFLIAGGLILFLTQGYIGATQHDIISRVKIATIFFKKPENSLKSSST
ncbi:MAG: hypothetical protein ACXAD7_06700 [Candidatus Kariarchaeaceae archaeon]